jgi:RES domain-containing protein
MGGFLSIFGGGDQSSQSTAYNEQVGSSQGSIAVGAGNSGTVNIMTSDAAAIAANQAISEAAISASGGVAVASFNATQGLASDFETALESSYTHSTDIISGTTTSALNAVNAALASSNNLASSLVGQYGQIQSASAVNPRGIAVAGEGGANGGLILLAAAALAVWLMLKK